MPTYLKIFFDVRKVFILILFIGISYSVQGQSDSSQLVTSSRPTSAQKKGWYESFRVRGYVQARYNRFLETNPNLGCEQCDAS